MNAYSEDTPNDLVDQHGQDLVTGQAPTGEPVGEVYTDEDGKPRIVAPADRPLTQMPRVQKEKEKDDAR